MNTGKKVSLAAAAMLLALALVSTASAQVRHESVLFAVDVSQTLSEDQEVAEAQDIVRDMNARFPEDVKSAGLLTFGSYPGPGVRWVAPPAGWERDQFDQAAAGIWAGLGRTFIGDAVKAAGAGVADSMGQTALIIVSDGKNNGWLDVIEQARAVKDQYGDRVCIFTIQRGTDPKGAALLASVAGAGGCGKAVNASEFGPEVNTQDLVDFIFPSGVAAPSPQDSDGDGVYDGQDQCPGTLQGAKVDSRGCWVLTGVNFDSSQSVIKDQYHPLLDEVVAVLNANPGVSIVIEGHTDSQGSDESNQALSQARAEAVMNYFISQGVDASRLSAKGYGESRPMADNETAEGRAQNRRVELSVVE